MLLVFRIWSKLFLSSNLKLIFLTRAI